MMTEQYIKSHYNKVDTLTAVCHATSSWTHGEYTELEIGKTYKITHIGILRSSTNIMLAEFPGKEYNADCFELFENGKPGISSKHANRKAFDVRFWAPYLREMWGHDFPDRLQRSMEIASIPAHIDSIEAEYNVKVLLAVESGSRAWGFESDNSDWDVRFIYVHKPEWYFSVEEKRDVIEHVYDDDVDLVGWELRKALTLLGKQNPSLMEWLASPIVYYQEEEFVRRIKEIADKYFNPIRSMYHYNHTYMKHDERYLQKEGCSMKRFLYYLRGVLACKWIEEHKTLPPVPFSELVKATVENTDYRQMIDDLLVIKKSGKECDILSVPTELVGYAQNLANYYNERVDSFRPELNKTSVKALDGILYDMVRKFA